MDPPPSPTSVVALGREERFFRWVGELVGDFRRCKDVVALLRLLRETICELVVIEGFGLSTDLMQLIGVVKQAGVDIPLVVVTDGSAPPVGPHSLAACWVSLSTPAAELSQAVTELRRRWVRFRSADKMTKEFVARLHGLDRWGSTMSQEIDKVLHDVRTPIGILQGFCANLLDGIDGELSDPQRHSLQRMQAAIELLGELSSNAQRGFPQRPSRELPALDRLPARRQIYLQEICEEVAQLFRPQARDKNVRLLDCFEACPPIWGDRVRLAQLLVNLLSNALRFTPEGETIEVALEPARHTGGRRGVLLRVRDGGPGIPEHQVEEIFSAGWTTGDSDHSGMGLAICKEVATEHGGKLTLSSEPGAGATFELLLPVDPRGRTRAVILSVIRDPTLAGQLVSELRDRLGATFKVEQPREMDSLADRLIRRGAELTLMGEVGNDPAMGGALAGLLQPEPGDE